MARNTLTPLHNGLLAGLALTAISLLLIYSNLSPLLPAASWHVACSSSSLTRPEGLLFCYSLLPRITLALLAGSGLGLAGWLCQLLLRNPLAEPATLGIASAAQLGLSAATLLGAGFFTMQITTLAGGLGGALVVFSLSRRHFSPLTLLLTGVIIGLLCQSVQNILLLFHQQSLQSLFLWNTGDLSQNDWSGVQWLLPGVLLATAITLLLARPLNLLRLSDNIVASMGAHSQRIRLAGLLLVATLTAWIVSVTGVIGFIGLFAPQLCRLSSRQRFTPGLLLVMLAGGLLLLFCDQLALFFARYHFSLRAGNISAFLGVPLMLLIIHKVRFISVPQITIAARDFSQIARRYRSLLVLLLPLLVLLCYGLTRDDSGWIISLNDPDGWRWPRVLIAACAGALLAVAGVILQRMTGNPLASPEVLGVSNGAACGVVIMLYMTQSQSAINGGLLPGALAGALLSLLILLIFSLMARGQPARLLLAGTALSALSAAIISLFLASGDPRGQQILGWLSGSTWRADPGQALIGMLLLVAFAPVLPLFSRWLSILPLGVSTAHTLGVPRTLSQGGLLLYCALLSASAVLLTGPMSFVGLLAPQLPRRLGITHPLTSAFAAVFTGAVLMMIADWLARQLVWPFQLPTGLIATLIGAPLFIWLLNRR